MAYQPKSYRKFVATTATAAMVASAVAPVVSAAAGFTDVASQYKDAVDFLVSAGVKGKSETKFGVYDEITRLDAAVILAKVLKLDVDNAKDAGFTDVPKDRAKYVNALVDAGVLNGKAAGKFGAYDKLTRAEMAKIIANAYKLKGDDVTLPFTDVNDTWAPYVKALYKNGITKGKSETKFGANDNITRGDFAVFVYRAANVDVAPQVVSVSAINAKEVQIKFNKAIKKDTIIAGDGTLVDGVITFNSVEGATAVNADASTAVLSEDGKTLTITANTTFNGKYVVSLAADKVKTADGTKFVEQYTSGILTFKDEVRPTLLGVSYPANGVATFTFSEPLNVTNAADIEAALEIRDANGNVVSAAGLVTLASDKKSFDLDISGFTVDKNYTVTIAGLKDFAGNLITPNPISTTVVNKVLDNVAPTIEKVEAVKTGVLKVTLSEKVKVQSGNVLGTYQVNGSGATNIVVGTGGNATLDSTGKVITITDATNFTGIKTITLNGFKDLSGNTLASPFSKVLEFKADTTKPAYVSHEVKEISGAQYLIVKYNEEITANNSAGNLSYTYVDSNQVTHTGSITNNSTNVVAYDTDGDSVNDALKISLAGLNAGNYTLSLPSGLANDTATPANASDAKTVTFTLGTLNDTGKPTIVDADSNPANGYSGITVQPTEDYVTVVFSENVSPATALNVANYTVEGQQVFESAILDGNQYTVKLKLKPNVITVTGLRNFTIQNVTDVAGNVMNPVTTQVNFVENVKPTITSATLTADNQITLTFSEAMTATSLTDNDDFRVKVDGNVVNISSVAQVGSTNSFTLTLASPVTDLSKPIVVEVLDTNDVTDAAAVPNKLSTTGTINVAK